MSNVAEMFEPMSDGRDPEADAAARAWLASHSARFGLFINGAWVQPADVDAFLDSRNPATGETLARIAVAGAKEVDLAVAAAAAAAPAWAKRRGHERARVLYALARLVPKSSPVLAG